MTSLYKRIANNFFGCKDCKIIPRVQYKEVFVCEPCREKEDAHKKCAENLPLDEAIREVVNGRLELMDARRAYDQLYEKYMDDMPYGIAKARDGDPDQWITERLMDEYAYLIEETVE